MTETLQLLSIISFAVAAVCFAIAVFFWFFFKIPDVIGDLSGRTARRSIAKMRAANEKSGSKSYKESKVNAERGKLTGTMPGIRKKKTDRLDSSKPETGLLNENKAKEPASETTGLLVEDEGTAPLDNQTDTFRVRSGGKKLKMLEEVILIHTEEVIG